MDDRSGVIGFRRRRIFRTGIALSITALLGACAGRLHDPVPPGAAAESAVTPTSAPEGAPGAAVEGAPIEISFETSEGTQLAIDLTPDGETIVLDLLGQLWRLPVEGGRAIPLTDAVRDTADDVEPEISPDGRVAFRSDRPGGRGLYGVALGGGPVARLLPDPDGAHEDLSPAWSPDGRRLAFVRDDRIHMLDPASGEVRPLPLTGLPDQARPRRLAYTPDGERLAFSAVGRIWWAPSEGGAADSLGPGGSPRVSPDGRRVAYVDRDDAGLQLRVRDLEGGEPQRLTSHEDYVGHARWSPDGESLIYSADGRLWRISAGGGPPSEIPFTASVRLTRRNTPLRPVRFGEPGTQRTARGHMGLAISPAADRIAAIALGRLWVFGADEPPRSVAELPATATGLSWSPDGRHVAWSAGPAGGEDLYATEVASGTIRRLTRLPGQAVKPSWSPDGRRIAFAYWAKPTLDTPPWHYDDTGARLLVISADPPVLEEPGAAEDLGDLPTGWTHPAFAAAQEALQWSPDASELLVWGGETATRVRLDGERTDVRLPPNASFLHWSADGSLVFVENGVLRRAPGPDQDPPSAEPEILSEGLAFYPTVARDGSVLYVSEDGLRLRSPDGSIRRLGWPLRYEVPDAPPPLLIRGARVIVGDGSPPTGATDVLLRGGRIDRIAPVGTMDPPEDAELLPAEGMTLLPGLIDMHVHLWDDAVLSAHLYEGVTAAREMGAPLGRVAGVRDAVDAGVRPGPRLLFGAFQIWGDGGFTGVTGHGPAGDEGRARTIELLRAFGADNLKLRTFSGWAPTARLIALAREQGWPVSGHMALPLPLVAAGISGMEHLGPSGRRTDRLLYGDVVRIFVEAGMWLVPTTVGYSQVPRVLDEPEILDSEHAPFVSPFLRWWLTRFPPDRHSSYSGFADLTRRGVAEMHAGGVTVLAGSDAPGLPWALHVELEELVRAGLSPLEALTAATGAPARALGADGEIGTIREGLRADLLLLEGDPLEDISHTRRIWAVIQGGRVVDRAAIRRRGPE